MRSSKQPQKQLILAVVLGAFACMVGDPAMSAHASTNGMKTIRDFGVLLGETAEANAAALQKAIDWAAPRGAALFVGP